MRGSAPGLVERVTGVIWPDAAGADLRRGDVFVDAAGCSFDSF
jgi:hypothetical protein